MGIKPSSKLQGHRLEQLEEVALRVGQLIECFGGLVGVC